jgi:hypothetical protein
MMKRVIFALLPTALAAAVLLPAPAGAADTIRVELNALESLSGKCRLSFVLENKGNEALQSLKLDLAVFNPAGIVGRRLVVELGPIRKAKTIVKAFELDSECAQIGALLVNDVAACVPGDPAACLDELALSSRAPDVRFYK